MTQNPPDYRHDTVLPLPMEVRADAWAVDAACSGNPGPMEYQAIDLQTGYRVFHFGPIHGTPSYMPWRYAGIRACTTRPSTATPIMPSSGYRSASARQNWSAHLRQNNSIRLSPEPRTGLTPIITEIPSSNGKPRNGVKFLPTSAGNKPEWLGKPRKS